MKFRTLFTTYFLAPVFLAAHSYDVVGIGSPCVDMIYYIDDPFLQTIELKKGDSQYAGSWERFSSAIEKSEALGYKAKMATGGSASNTIKGLAQLEHDTAFLGKVGMDPSGCFYTKMAEELNIHLPIENAQEPATLQIAVFVTEDQQRTFLSYRSSGSFLSPDNLNPPLFEKVNLVHFEGYTLNECSLEFLEKAMTLAKTSGSLISFDMGCMRIAQTCSENILHFLKNYVDIVFANEAEIEALLNMPFLEASKVLATYCPVSVVLLGEKGALVSHKEKQFYSPARFVKALDTTGAGDLFITGFLHGYLKGYELQDCAWIGNLLGGAVVTCSGGEIPAEKWPALKQEIHEHLEAVCIK
jgi:sugar/nucleoside kinase (ribokinase family)